MPNFEKYRKDKAVFTFPVSLAGISVSADVVTALTMPKAGLITGFRYVADVVTSTGGKSVVFNIEIGSTNLTGGELTLTTALGTPKGKVTEATAITGNNAFNAGDTISIEAVVGVAFVEGSGSFEVEVEYL